MKSSNLPLDRLLLAAATSKNDQLSDMPYGFDTRVLARARANQQSNLIAVANLLRRFVLLSLGVIAVASAGAYHELRQSDDLGDSLIDEYVIADSVVGSVFEQ